VIPGFLCPSCAQQCGILIHSQYCLAAMMAYSNNQPVPECLFYKELLFHGLEGVRP